MKKVQSVNLIVMIIGSIAIILGIYNLSTGGAFQDYFFEIFIGITLFGTAYFNNNEWKKKGVES